MHFPDCYRDHAQSTGISSKGEIIIKRILGNFSKVVFTEHLLRAQLRTRHAERHRKTQQPYEAGMILHPIFEMKQPRFKRD